MRRSGCAHGRSSYCTHGVGPFYICEGSRSDGREGRSNRAMHLRSELLRGSREPRGFPICRQMRNRPLSNMAMDMMLRRVQRRVATHNEERALFHEAKPAWDATRETYETTAPSHSP